MISPTASTQAGNGFTVAVRAFIGTRSVQAALGACQIGTENRDCICAIRICSLRFTNSWLRARICFARRSRRFSSSRAFGRASRPSLSAAAG